MYNEMDCQCIINGILQKMFCNILAYLTSASLTCIVDGDFLLPNEIDS